MWKAVCAARQGERPFSAQGVLDSLVLLVAGKRYSYPFVSMQLEKGRFQEEAARLHLMRIISPTQVWIY